MEIFNQREDTWRRRLDRETERRRTVERQLKTAQEAVAATRLNASLLGRRVRMGPGKAHQRSHSHGGQQNLFGNQQLFPPSATNPSLPPVAAGASGAPVSAATTPGAANTGKMFIVEECGPDFAEGGSEYSVSEEHFYDAIDAQLDKMHRKFCLCVRAVAICSSHKSYFTYFFFKTFVNF